MIEKLSHGLDGIKAALKTEPTLIMQLVVGTLATFLFGFLPKSGG